MFRKFISIALIIAIVNLLGVVSVFADEKSEEEIRLTNEVKENIQKLGTGESAKVKVTLKDKSKIKGYVSQTSENSFTVVRSKTGQTAEVEYSQVKKVKGKNLSNGTKIAIGVGAGLGILMVVFLANRKVQCRICP